MVAKKPLLRYTILACNGATACGPDTEIGTEEVAV